VVAASLAARLLLSWRGEICALPMLDRQERCTKRVPGAAAGMLFAGARQSRRDSSGARLDEQSRSLSQISIAAVEEAAEIRTDYRTGGALEVLCPRRLQSARSARWSRSIMG